MRTLKFLLQKEFKQIFRNKAIIGIILAMPVIQLLILPLAADFEVKNINLAVVDNDHSTYSQQLVSTVIASGYFKLVDYNQSYKQSLQLVESDKADLILEIPVDMERNLVREGSQQVFIAVNAINGTKANLGAYYLSNIIRNYNKNIRSKLMQAAPTPTEGAPSNQSAQSGQPVIEIASSNWFNPAMEYKPFMVPGILAFLVTMVGGFLSALNIVKEKEIGTIEQINVTPIKKSLFILGKLIPFWIMGNVVFTLGLLIIRIVYGIVPEGSILVLYCFIWVYLLAVLGFGLLISTYSDTQQQAMFIMFFFIMIFILLSGLFTSIDSMPGWAKVIAYINPVSHIVDVFRMVILKGSSLRDILPHIGVISVLAVILNTWAVFNYKKTV